MIIYGWNTYLLKSISPTELGVPEDHRGTKIEFRQKYFHLFFIPFFPIGRVWSVRQGGTLYQPSGQLQQALQHVKPGGKHRVWAWSGPLLGIAIYFIVSIMNNVEEKASKNRVEKNRTLLSAFFQDKNKTAPLVHKLNIMDTLIDSSLAKVKYENKAIDTSMNELLGLYLEASLTRSDSLTGYDPNNTMVISHFRGTNDRKELINRDYKASLEAGEWKGYYGDTSSVFADLRKLQQYKYILLLKEYNKVAPRIEGSGFASGYYFVQGTILSIETGKTQRNFKVMAGNSDKVSHYSVRSKYASSSPDLKFILENDLKKNVLQEAYKYVFGKGSSYL